ncbi:uncharacterized protein LOC114847983 isoform X2 [Betta splendens]|uniref:Uncharacterized protein LOC114847983 isoform X2 n=1 Tax=Betta splendens TaxID=158456 RepID=A0A9W2XIG8_BETSP|nr:uncharacterized protein LOC114847983 isoform X2 [Betta splendens]
MESRLRDREVEAEQQRRSLDGLEQMVVQQRERTDKEGKQLMQLEEQSKAQVLKLSAEVSLLQSRLNVSEHVVEDLRRKNTALAAELPFLQTRLRASESTVEQLRRKSAVLAVRLCNSEALMEELRMQISAFPASNSSSWSEATELETRLNIILKQLNSEALHSRLDSLEAKLNSLAAALGRTDQLFSRMKDAEKQLDHVPAEITALSSRLGAAERHLEELQARSTDETSELMNLEEKLNSSQSLQRSMNTELLNRLRVTEKHWEAAHRQNTDQSVQLSSMESRLSDSSSNTTALELRVRVSEKHLDDLQTNNTELMRKLRVNEKHMEELRGENTGQSFTLMDLQRNLNTTERLLNIINTELENLKTENTGFYYFNSNICRLYRLNPCESGSGFLVSVQFGQISLLESRLLGNISGCEVQLVAVGLRLHEAGEQVDELRSQNTATAAELGTVSEQLTMNRREIEELQLRVTDGEAAVTKLMQENKAQSLLLTEVNSTLKLVGSKSQASHSSFCLAQSCNHVGCYRNPFLSAELENRLRLGETQLDRLKHRKSCYECPTG